MKVAILGTMSSHGGVMITAAGSRTITSNGPVCLLGDSHDCPAHKITPIVSNCSKSSNQGGVPVAIEGAVAGCGAVLTSVFAKNYTTS